MGGCVSSLMMTRSDMSNVPHSGIMSYRNRPKPLTNAITDSPEVAGESKPLLYGKMDTAGVNALQEELYSKYGTILSLFRESCVKNGAKKALGYRPVNRIEQTTIKGPDGKEKKWEYIHLNETVEMTYADLWKNVAAFGRGLSAIGVNPKDMMGIYEDTRYEWIVACYGIWCAGAVGVTVYANLGEDALVYAVKEAELGYMLCNAKLIKNLLKLCKGAGIPVPTLIYTDTLPADLDLGDVKAYAYEDIIKKGSSEEAMAKPLVADPAADDLALIMYTSGTTGDPKGVMMSYGNVTSAVLTLGRRVVDFLGEVNESLVYLAYLPLAHILEFAAENCFLLKGLYLGYGNPRTLTDTSARPRGDLTEFRPHLLIGVPRVFETIRKGVEAAIPTGLKRRIYEDAYQRKLNAYAEGKDTPYLNHKVFASVKEKLGGRVVACLSGGAPLSAKVHEFLNVITGATVVQGYGLTETCACTTTQLPYDQSTDCGGCLLESIEVKLRDASEWKHTDKPWPRGEILVRGPMVTKGYYKQPEMTKEAFLEGGWFATGDVGAIDDDGNIRIIGRVKALVKNSFGEYVALDALEAVYCLNPIALPNGVCVLVNSHKSFICALVVTDETKAMAFAQEHGIEGTWPEILKNPAYQKKATESFALTAKQSKRKPFEVVKKVVVLPDEWTPDNGILTAAQKLKRREIDKRYADLITELFATDPE